MIRDIPAEQTSSTKQHHAASTAVRLLHGGGEGGEEEVLSCPSCNRDYELPRRCMRRHGDYDFNPIPRLLPCLHSLCHSCLEAQYENEGKNEIECVLCHHQEVIASVNVLPLHITILKQIVTNNSTQLMAVCARCYDDVTSTSWCETCSSALCDFHHQDHKLSVDTSKHNIATFKEYLHQGKHITYQFPPISCPQCPMQDCSLYCQHCLHVLSPKAFIDFHKTHPVCDIEDVTNEMQQAVDDSIVQSKTYSEKVHGKIKEIKRVLRTLDEQEEESMLVLTKTFNSIHAKLKKREKELLEKMTHSMSIQRKLLLDQLSSYMELYEDCNHVVQVAEAVRRDTQDTMTELMYLVAATDSIEYRSDSLAEQVDQQIKSTVLIDPRCRVDFMVEDLHILQGTINRLGGVYIAEEEKHMPWPKVQSEHSTSTTPRHHDEIEEEVMDNVYFTVEVR